MGWCTAPSEMLYKSHHEGFRQYWASPFNERIRKKKTGFCRLQPSGSVLLQCLFIPLGDLLVLRTLEDEWYIVTKPYKFIGFERFLYCVSTLSPYILTVHYSINMVNFQIFGRPSRLCSAFPSSLLIEPQLVLEERVPEQ